MTAKNKPDRNWTGLESYGFGKRFYWDFHYGWTNFANAGKGFISRGATSDVTKFEYGDVDVCIGYSIYKDHHFAAGLGLGFKAVGYTFNDLYIVAAQTGDSYTLEAMDAPSAQATIGRLLFKMPLSSSPSISNTSRMPATIVSI